MISKRLLLPFACFLMCSSVYAQVPYTFKAGDPADAEQVNADFTALENQIGQLETQIAALSGASADNIPGTYDLQKLGVLLRDNGNGNYDIANSSFTGTVVFNSDGTGTYSSSEGDTTLNVTTSTTTDTVNNQTLTHEQTDFHFQTDPPSSNTGSLTWTLSGNNLNVSPSGGSPLTFIVSGKLAVAVDPSDGRAIYIAIKE